MFVCARTAIVVVAGFVLLVDTACSRRRTETPRTATEQFLISHAAASALSRLELAPLKGRTIFLDPQYLEAVDKPFLLGELRGRILLAGGRLAEKREQADTIVEARSLGVGIDSKECLLGIPRLAVPMPAPAVGGGVPVNGGVGLPEVPIFKHIRQDGWAGVALEAYDAKSGERLHAAGPALGLSTRSDWIVLFITFHTKENFPY